MEKITIISLYVACWNNPDSATRLVDLEKCYAKDGTYADPHVPETLQNVAAMNDLITLFRSRLTHQLKLIGEPEFHHNVFRIKCKLENEQGILNKLTFVGEFNTEGVICKVIGFIDAKE